MIHEVRQYPRITQSMDVVVMNGGVHRGVVQNISKNGLFVKIPSDCVPLDNGRASRVNLQIKVDANRVINLWCSPRWHNDEGVGFRTEPSADGNEDAFQSMIDNLSRQVSLYGPERVFRTEIFITLRQTNAFGNVYFAEYFTFQGAAREQMLVRCVPNLREEIFGKGIRLVTVDAYNKYITNAYFGDTVVAEITTREVTRVKATVNIRFRNKTTGKLIGDGYQTFCCVDANGKIIRLPGVFEFLDYFRESHN